MTPSPRLEVTDVRRLVGGSFGGLRVSLTGEGITARSLLTGDFGGQPLVGVVRQPGRPRDLVGTYWAGVYLVSEHFRRCMSDLGTSGWFTTPVQVEGIQSQLWLLSISGRCGPLFGVGGDPYPGGPDVGTFIDPARWEGLTSSWPTTTRHPCCGIDRGANPRVEAFECCPRVGWAGARSL
jgi:hypothetical protein